MLYNQANELGANISEVYRAAATSGTYKLWTTKLGGVEESAAT
eukprot:SAG22_NODE_16987_length_313_cov_1.205607_2_plen_42_part_01